MLARMLDHMQNAVEVSMLGFVEVASVAVILYYIYAKTRAVAIISGLFPNLNVNIDYRSSLIKFNNMGSELLVTLRNGTVISGREDTSKVTKANTKSETKRSYVAHGVGTENMLEVTPHAGRKPYHSIFDWGVYFPYFAQSLRSKKYYYPQVSPLVVKDPLLSRAIKQAAEQILREQRLPKKYITANNHDGDENDEMENAVYQEILKGQEKRAYGLLMDMRSTLNNFLLTLTSWILYRLLPCFLSGVVTNKKQIKMLKKASDRAPGTPLIFLPLHRSHLDYILVTFILKNNDIRSPLVAAGNNLQIPVFGGLLRGLGAFFIKRKIDPIVGKKDIVYRAVLQLYLQHALKMGHNAEFFIEGGRTRTGKPCMPKGGILSVIVNAFMDGSIPDALLVPVSVNYERLVDGNFVREQKGERKVPESFGKAISGIWKALNSKYGLMRIDFNEPYSIRELVNSYNKIAKEEGNAKIYTPAERSLQHNQSTSSLYGTDVVCEEHRTLIESISRQIVFDCASATSVMSTNALAFLLLTRYRKGATVEVLSKCLDDFRSSVGGQKDIGFAGESKHIINYASELLGNELIQRSRDESGKVLIRPAQRIESFIELSYYSNMLTPHFALQSILLTTFHNLLPIMGDKGKDLNKNNTDSLGISRRKLIEIALENCEVFRYEFILSKPTQGLESLLELALDELIVRSMIKTLLARENTDHVIESRKLANGIAHFFESDDDYDYVDEEQKYTPDIFYTVDTIDDQKAVCEVLAPFGCTYLAVAQSLNILYENPMLETEFIKFVIVDLTNKYNNDLLSYAESISTDSVRNCLKLLEKWSVVEICNQNGLRLLSLGNLYETSKDSLKNVVQRIRAVVPNYKNGYFG